MFVTSPEYRSSLLKEIVYVNPYEKTNFEIVCDEFFCFYELAPFKDVRNVLNITLKIFVLLIFLLKRKINFWRKFSKAQIWNK